MITCSENCFYAEDGICTLNEVSKPSSTPIKDCPYYKEKNKKKKRGGINKPPSFKLLYIKLFLSFYQHSKLIRRILLLV